MKSTWSQAALRQRTVRIFKGQKLTGDVVRRNVNLSVEVGIFVFGGSTKTTRKL